MNKITFSFGKNWSQYAETIDAHVVETAKQTLANWLGEDTIARSKIVDIGSGSGLSSRALIELGCKELIAFDYDPASVATTTHVLKQFPDTSIKVFQGSILDMDLVKKYEESCDIVHSWGVLHHTGEMWKAIDNASKFCAREAYFFIALYQAGHKYEEHLRDKVAYNAMSENEKIEFVEKTLGGHLKSVSRISTRNSRGMNEYHDLIDWYGGLPYEVAYPSEVILYLAKRGFRPLRLFGQQQGGCTEYLFKNTGEELSDLLSANFQWGHCSEQNATTQTFQERLSADLSTAVAECQRESQSAILQLRKTTDSIVGCARRAGSLILKGRSS